MKSWKCIYLTDEPINNSEVSFNYLFSINFVSSVLNNELWNPVSKILIFPKKSPTDAYLRSGLREAPQQVIPKDPKLNYFTYYNILSYNNS